MTEVAMADIDQVEGLSANLDATRKRGQQLEADTLNARMKKDEAELKAANLAERLRMAKDTIDMKMRRLAELEYLLEQERRARLAADKELAYFHETMR